MGQFSLRVTVPHPSDPGRTAEVDLLVDTGATLSWVPRAVLDQLAAPRLPGRSFLLANGSTVQRETAAVIIAVNSTYANVTVVVKEPGDAHLLGATTLETLGFTVEPVHQRLVPQSLLAM